MRIGSWVRNRRVITLIDNGSTHNFINQDVAKKINLKVTPIDPFQVRVANGDRLTCSHIYKAVPIKLQGVGITADLYAIPLGGTDIVLGIQWLENLGKVVTDYKAGTMEFKWGDGLAKIEARTGDQMQEIGIKSLERMIQKGAQCYAIKIERKGPEPPVDSGKRHQDITNILTKYSMVVNEPQGLPLKRRFDHHIPLKDESQAVNVHPYRYTYFQKNEIERQVNEMLKQGLIRPSNNPFSSPVLLVKKKRWNLEVLYGLPGFKCNNN